MNNKDKLRQAATLVQEVIATLDLRKQPCDAGHEHFSNPTDARVYERLKDTPDKLKTAANQLNGHIRGLAPPCQETTR